MSLPYERGVQQISELYDATPSRQAQAVLYYLQRAGHFYCDTFYSVEREHYPSFLLLYVIRGALRLRNRGREAVVREGELSLINCYEPHSYRADCKLEYLWLHFDGANTTAFYDAIWQTHGPVIRTDNKVGERMQQIINQLRTMGQIEEVTASRRLHDLLCSLLYAADRIESEDPLIASVQRYLNEHLQEEIFIPLLAQQFHLSASQLSRLFKSHTGQSPHEYLVNLRINRAKTLLKETRMSVTQIAGEVGYAYDTSFASAFRSKVGMSPRRFREMPI
ncbi:MAG: helix-turn-helix domain-containing protein [Butyricicoccaceae bacterium]